MATEFDSNHSLGRETLDGNMQVKQEGDYVVNHFKGEVFASGYGIWVDYKTNPAGHKRLFEIMERCDGTRNPADIAAELGLQRQVVWEIIEKFLEKGLVSLSPVPRPSHLQLN
jgi:hypothetical protein